MFDLCFKKPRYLTDLIGTTRAPFTLTFRCSLFLPSLVTMHSDFQGKVLLYIISSTRLFLAVFLFHEHGLISCCCNYQLQIVHKAYSTPSWRTSVMSAPLPILEALPLQSLYLPSRRALSTYFWGSSQPSSPDICFLRSSPTISAWFAEFHAFLTSMATSALSQSPPNFFTVSSVRPNTKRVFM